MSVANLTIDFDVLGCSTNCKVLKIIDLSNWSTVYANASYIDITVPGSSAPISAIFSKHTVNDYNSNDLELTNVTDFANLALLPDGVYRICVRVIVGYVSPQALNATPSPIQTGVYTDPVYESSCKYWLQDCQLRCAIARKLISIDLTCQPCRKKLLEDLQEIQLFLDAAQAQIINCNVNKAMEYFQRSQLLLSRLLAPGEDLHCNQCH